MTSYANKSLEEIDKTVFDLIKKELERQQNAVEMIASENIVPKAILQAQGSILTNKYAEGYPNARYYGGCEYVDVIEQLAIDRAKELFACQYANVQPHSGASANAAVLQGFLKPGETILGLALDHGGHLTHGMRLNFSGHYYQVIPYGTNPKTALIDMDQVRDLALKHRPKIIIAGWSAYSRIIDFAAFRQIADEVGAYLWTDMAHFAGLVAAGLHPNPMQYSDVVTSTMHKTLCGPRSGLILAKSEYAKKLNTAVFPGVQGGPLEHVIAAKAVALKLAMTDEFKQVQQRTLQGAKIIANRLSADDAQKSGIKVLTGGTDVHLVLLDLQKTSLSGLDAQTLLESIGITANRNSIPFDPRPPAISSGLRLGTPALATRGFDESDFVQLADLIAELLINATKVDLQAIKQKVTQLVAKHPIYQ